MPPKKHFHINPQDLAAARALSALHPEYENEDYEEDNTPLTPEEEEAIRKAIEADNT